jgi:hypothetical protein
MSFHRKCFINSKLVLRSRWATWSTCLWQFIRRWVIIYIMKRNICHSTIKINLFYVYEQQQLSQTMRGRLRVSSRIWTESELRLHQFRHIRMGIFIRLSSHDTRFLGEFISIGKVDSFDWLQWWMNLLTELTFKSLNNFIIVIIY